MKKQVMEEIKGGLIVSCQARVGWAMYGSSIMAAFASAAKEGGAVGIRATGKDNLLAIKEKVDLPLIGINKQFRDDCDVYITPTYESAKEILDIGIDIIALDATKRARPNGENIESIVQKIKENYPEVLIMGEISTLEEAKYADTLGFDFLSTTLSGYTSESSEITSVNLKLIKEISEFTDTPIIAEGKIETPDEARLALESGAYTVVVGTSITRPEILTKRFSNEVAKFSNK
ncbi:MULTISPECIES: N-acetylmannosamine-6-phosphate 2-epimerase [unclassified Breznakia]|uniref:N-acetylmannosamine-6-phosphate 2-epimerase n=1 Tax=unclassified Breznakia TaxID=2623764 RepID=UPI0024748A00|nr:MULTISPECIES: N-acetylmannosamine-6-phosphate 2-epimerase [unclassified Breznakia]MDH6365932.1 N-acylglucosamine-6-phosphate 2-epimerase [Breznakia sp. PH1-1]MDH6403136.1 N-acylglucosamine-6-phosphate 2-epimerase [Breznakia sp. PF1-11]MDH6410845.1 N-acylglucosamine-6-phosphate 2-epimerase [Breznakia sp. PFB1-11]MDH6413098.1 N-acylglucosamine-6-phosphate 2-epimerase [Breznakia sp. PFB1-14]MDH6415466.1 N-acylglucosamine-6-phosphate 2-epimerase [Breznakia sp. PFB1-4]